MTADGYYHIVWLDDDHDDVSEIAGLLSAGTNAKVSLVKTGADALDMIAPPAVVSLLIVDFLLDPQDGRGAGVDIAAQIRSMSPQLPIMVVTHYLDDFAPEAMRQEPYPFDAVFEKDALVSLEQRADFLRRVLELCQWRWEQHPGQVVSIQSDYTEVELTNPTTGRKYLRLFETQFLKYCGIEWHGQQCSLTFQEWTTGRWGRVSMTVRGERIDKEAKLREVKERMQRTDWDEMAKKFDSLAVEGQE